MPAELRETTKNQIGTIKTAVDFFEALSSFSRGPYLSLLGPRGSGTSDYLQRLQCHLQHRKDKDFAYKPILIDLNKFPLSTSDRMFKRILNQLAAACGIEDHITPSGKSPKIAFRDLIKSILRKLSGYRLVLLIDHLECVPRSFVRSVAAPIREMIESVDEEKELRRLSVVVTGSLSIYELKHDRYSLFHYFEPILLPTTNLEAQRILVRDHLEKFYTLATDSLETDLLINATSGEPCFLKPLLTTLLETRESLPGNENQYSIQSVIDKMSALDSPIAELRDLAFQVALDDELRILAGRLGRDKGDGVTPQGPNLDINAYQLKGFVTISNKIMKPRYHYRNAIVASYLNFLLKYYNSQTLCWSTRPQIDESSMPPLNNSDSPSIIVDIIRLVQLKTSIQIAEDSTHNLSLIRKAWYLLGGCDEGEIFLFVSSPKIERNGWWIIPNSRVVIGPIDKNDKRIPLATRKAAVQAVRTREPNLGLGKRNIALGVPVEQSGIRVAVNVTLPYSGKNIPPGSLWTESRNSSWATFLYSIGSAIVWNAIAQIGAWTLHLTDQRTKMPEENMLPFRPIINEFNFKEGTAMGDIYQTGQAGTAGPHGRAENINFNQIWVQSGQEIDLPKLATQLSLLRDKLRGESKSLEQDVEIGAVAAAEKAAIKGDGVSVLENLSRAGNWTMSVAEKIGVPVAIEALKKALGL